MKIVSCCPETEILFARGNTSSYVVFRVAYEFPPKSVTCPFSAYTPQLISCTEERAKTCAFRRLCTVLCVVASSVLFAKTREMGREIPANVVSKATTRRISRSVKPYFC